MLLIVLPSASQTKQRRLMGKPSTKLAGTTTPLTLLAQRRIKRLEEQATVRDVMDERQRTSWVKDNE